MSNSEYLRLEKEGNICNLVLSRPERLNAMDRGFFQAMGNAFEEIGKDEEIRAVIISGEGKAFSAGTDLKDLGNFLQGVGAKDRRALRGIIEELQAGFDAVEQCDRPVIAAIHGYCIGGGVDLISSCDIRIATRDAIFSIRETRMAIVPDLGTVQRLPYIIGHGYFRELALTGRDFGAEEAYRMGLVTHLCKDKGELMEKAREIALEIASCPPLTVRALKEAIIFSRDYGVRAGLQVVAHMNAYNIPSEDLWEAMAAFKEKRRPRFLGQ
ncbi:MAG: enoyl-CoA hydratase-related protein [Desulfatiglandales bacterium]